MSKYVSTERFRLYITIHLDANGHVVLLGFTTVKFFGGLAHVLAGYQFSFVIGQLFVYERFHRVFGVGFVNVEEVFVVSHLTRLELIVERLCHARLRSVVRSETNFTHGIVVNVDSAVLSGTASSVRFYELCARDGCCPAQIALDHE